MPLRIVQAQYVTIKEIKEMREKYDDLAVVCYINSTAEIKSICGCLCDIFKCGKNR